MKNWAVVRDGRGGEDTPNLYCEWVLGASLLAFELPLRTEGGGVQKDRYVGPLVIFRRGRAVPKRGAYQSPNSWVQLLTDTDQLWNFVAAASSLIRSPYGYGTGLAATCFSQRLLGSLKILALQAASQ